MPGDGTRDRVLDAAVTVFRTRGYHMATMDEIARISRSSKKTIYKLFSSKEVLFLSLLDTLKHELSLLPIDLHAPPDEALRKFLLEVARILLTDSSLDLLRTIMRAQSENPDLARTAEACHADQVALALEGYLDRLGRSGGHDVGRPEDASRMLIGLALGAFHHEMLLGLRASIPDEALHDRIARAVTIFLRGTERLPDA
jgi:AcrR family transcriptional regulator